MSIFNQADLFLEPKTTQYGSHMIMTNVNKPKKTKYVNVDTRFRDEYNYLQNANFTITIPERINDVKSIRLTNIEIPMSFYNISANLGNNCFEISSNGIINTIVIPDNNYNITSLTNSINSQLLSNGYDISFSYTGSVSNVIVRSHSATLNFAVDNSGNNDKYNFKNKLGWLLGFRQPVYNNISTNSIITTEALYDLNGPRYLYLAVEEFNKGNQNSFVTPMFSSLINKNIIARITMDSQFPFGSILPANRYNGLLTSDHRSYTGKIDLQRLNIQLLNENGIPMNLNGLDFSFCLEIEHE